jgi:hypothetical protein
MSKYITLTRKAAAIKLQAAKAASYFMLIGDNGCYSKSVTVQQMVRAFETDDRARLRIRLNDSQHTVFIENHKGMRTGYRVYF